MSFCVRAAIGKNNRCKKLYLVNLTVDLLQNTDNQSSSKLWHQSLAFKDMTTQQMNILYEYGFSYTPQMFYMKFTPSFIYSLHAYAILHNSYAWAILVLNDRNWNKNSCDIMIMLSSLAKFFRFTQWGR